MLGANWKLGGGGLQLIRLKLSTDLERKPKKTSEGQDVTRGLVQLQHKTSPQQTDPKRPMPTRAVNLFK